MSQTDSLEDEMTLTLGPELQTMALRLSLSETELDAALKQLERLTPVSARVGLQLLHRLSLEAESWKTSHQARLLQLSLQEALDGKTLPEVLALRQALKQTYPELFGPDA